MISISGFSHHPRITSHRELGTLTSFPLNVTITSSTNAICNGTSTGSITASVSGGSGNYTFTWSNGNTTSNTTNTVNTINFLDAGTYTVIVSDDSANVDTAMATLTEPPAVVLMALVDSNISCNGLTDGGLTALASGGTAPYTYTWSNGATTASITELTAGNYTVSVSDANGCANSVSNSITEPDPLSVDLIVVSNVTCFGLQNGSISANVNGGTPPFQYMWSNSMTEASIDSLAAGVYEVLMTDANGCLAQGQQSITQPDPLSVDLTVLSNVTCFGLQDGIISSNVNGGTPPFDYTWSNGMIGSTIDSLPAGAYEVSITDGNGCLVQGQQPITQPSQILVEIQTLSEIKCFGDDSGQLKGLATGGTPPYFFEWSTGQIGATLEGIPSAEYTLMAVDASGCAGSQTKLLPQPNPLQALSNIDQPASCFELSDGKASAQAIGGTIPYTFSWSNGATGQEVENLAPGNYGITIEDGNGCIFELEGFMEWEDKTPPSIVFDDTDITLDNTGQKTITFQDLNLEVNDICGLESIIISPHTFDCSDAGATLVTVTAIDQSEDVSTAEAFVMIEEVEIEVLREGNTLEASMLEARYQWIDCDNGNSAISGANEAIFTPQVNGNYAVIVTKNGCQSISECVAITDIATRIQEIEVREAISLYPNPSSGSFSIDLDKTYAQVSLELTTVTGKLIQQEQFFQTQQVQTMANVPAGFYFVKLTLNGTHSSTFKIRIE